VQIDEPIHSPNMPGLVPSQLWYPCNMILHQLDRLHEGKDQFCNPWQPAIEISIVAVLGQCMCASPHSIIPNNFARCHVTEIKRVG